MRGKAKALQRHQPIPGFSGALTAVLLFGLLSISCAATADLRLSDFFVDLYPQHRTDAIYATNKGEETLYLKVEVTEVIDPLSEQPTIRQIADPRALGVLVSPQRIVLKPGEEGRIRILALDEPEQDRFYRISVVPTTGALETEDAVGVKVMIGYAAWVYVRPQGARPELEAKRKGRALLLRNTGSTLAQLVMGEQCVSAGECQPIKPFRVLAGATRSVELPYEDGDVSFRMTWGDKSRKLIF